MRRSYRRLSLGLFVLSTAAIGCTTPRSDGLPEFVVDAAPTNPGPGPRGNDGPAPPPGTPGVPSTPAMPGTPDDPGCPAGTHNCKGQCVDNMLPENCGLSCEPCVSVEGGKATCDGKLCGGSCPAGQKLCANKCIPENDPCADMCPGGKNLCNGVCVDPTSLSACGSSCSPCPSSPNGATSCDGDKCELKCNPGFHKCEDSCFDDTKPTSCGASCSPCPVPTGGKATCTDGKCGAECPSGSKLCAGACIPSGQACNGVCPNGQKDCNGSCVPNNDVNFCDNCSPCGARENANVKCENNACVFTCRGGFHDCDQQCKDNRSVNSCGDRCDRCPAPANSTPSCDGNRCDFSCNQGFHRCGDSCIPRTQACNGMCPDGRRNCGGSCVEGNCCGDSDCGACKSCQGNRCQNTQDGVAGPGCSGTCRECNNGSCRDRPGSKTCGNACVSDNTCCTNGQPNRCPDCSTCMGNGQCSAPSGISCGNGQCVNPERGECCESCSGNPCRQCSADGRRCVARTNMTCTPSGGGDGRCNASGGCDLVKVANGQECTRGNAQCQSNNCSMNLCCPNNQRRCRNQNVCKAVSNDACGPDCQDCPQPVGGGGRGVCRGDDCTIECDSPLRLDNTRTRCIQCTQNGDCNDFDFPVCEGNRCVRETRFRFEINSAEYGFNSTCESACGGSVPQDRRDIFGDGECRSGTAPCEVPFPRLNGNSSDPCPGCLKHFRWSWRCVGERSGARGPTKNASITSHDPGDVDLNGQTNIRITCP